MDIKSAFMEVPVYSEDRLPEDRLPEDRLPEDRLLLGGA